MRNNTIIATLVILFFFACDYNPYPQGKQLYEGQCAGCHGIEGEGFRNLYPPLVNSKNFKTDPYNTACLIVNGLEGPMEINGKIYDQRMLAIEGMTDVQITNILNYVAKAFNKEVPTPLNIDLVNKKLEECKDDPKVY